jgi:hypothetical protein
MEALSSTCAFPAEPTPEIAGSTFRDHLFYQRLIGPLPTNLEELGSLAGDALQQGLLPLVTDGSYAPTSAVGSHGWVFAAHNNILWRGHGPTAMAMPNQWPSCRLAYHPLSLQTVKYH